MSTVNLPTVLIVDDERINRTALAELLKDECRVVLAKDGVSALQRVAEEQVSLILLDASMPDMDGYEVLRRLKSNEKTANIGVIFVTGQIEEAHEERGLLLGALDYIAKPVRPLLVKARVRNHLELARQREELERLSLQDALTGISNRRAFNQAFMRACGNTVRNGTPLGLAMIDVDYFKRFNDLYGHGAGDDVLRRVAQTLGKAAQRPYDMIARYGGEEFVLMLPSSIALQLVLNRLCEAVQALAIPHEQSEVSPMLTISCGGVVAGHDSARRPEQLLERCDEILYQAKNAGRNRAIVHDLH
ncbi:GGDEF domain-containing response regulator [Comamonas odontotermitis]|uniref:GGDEF domain-containing response regulator n=1 Tax=Comamonas TaxID=283 RepID=UPI001CC536D4|nr:diguanylate cyclase [Comamonas odontotermitis]UBB15809.1 diguanylate cyclase [Comamonas odontotermitis]